MPGPSPKRSAPIKRDSCPRDPLPKKFGYLTASTPRSLQASGPTRTCHDSSDEPQGHARPWPGQPPTHENSLADPAAKRRAPGCSHAQGCGRERCARVRHGATSAPRGLRIRGALEWRPVCALCAPRSSARPTARPALHVEASRGKVPRSTGGQIHSHSHMTERAPLTFARSIGHDWPMYNNQNSCNWQRSYQHSLDFALCCNWPTGRANRPTPAEFVRGRPASAKAHCEISSIAMLCPTSRPRAGIATIRWPQALGPPPPLEDCQHASIRMLAPAAHHWRVQAVLALGNIGDRRPASGTTGACPQASHAGVGGGVAGGEVGWF